MTAADVILILVIVAGALVPGHTGADDFDIDSYFDHIIDSSIERLQLNKEPFYHNVKIQEPEPFGFGMPVEGSILFNGIRSFGRSKNKYGAKHTKSHLSKNGDKVLLSTFQFDNVSGSGNFSGVDKHGERINFPFEFHMMPVEVQVTFLLPNGRKSKISQSKFVQPPVFDKMKSYLFLNVSLLVTNQSGSAFHTPLQDLYAIIQEKLLETPHKHVSHFDTILDTIFKRESANVNPIKYLSSSTHYEEATKEKIAGKLDVTAYGLRSLERVAEVHLIDEIKGDYDIRAQIKFGNVSGTVHVVGKIPILKYEDRFNFTATPAVVEALFYLPRNKSHQAVTFHFLNKPSYTVKNDQADLRSFQEDLIVQHGHTLYKAELTHILHETQNEVFSKVEG